MDIEPNCSDHLPVKSVFHNQALVVSSFNNVQHNRKFRPEPIVKQLRWDHFDIIKYYSCTFQGLTPIHDYINEFCHSNKLLINDEFHLTVSISNCVRSDAIRVIEDCYTGIVDVLNESASYSIPCVHKNFFKFWWDQELQALKDESIAAHKQWVNQGRPRQGQYLDTNRSKRNHYKCRLKELRCAHSRSISNSLHDALVVKDQSSFWKMWKSKFPNKTSSSPHYVDGATDHTDIANRFALAFESACSSVSATKNNRWKEQFVDHIFFKMNVMFLIIIVCLMLSVSTVLSVI